MNRTEATRILSGITYKPGHILVYEFKGTSNVVLTIYWSFERPDCNNPSEWGVGRSGPVTVYLPDIYTEEQLVRTVFGMTMRLEEHEAREFYMYNGDRPFDPHVPLIKKSIE